MKTKFAIIGGGIAGLCAAIRLAELGEEPLLIEGGSYPAHKVCGEFLSPECIPFLHEWNIHPTLIPQVHLNTLSSQLTFTFPFAAGGLSHLQLDPALAEFAAKCGAKIKTNTQVQSLQPKRHSKDTHLIQLPTGETIEALHVIIATGRIPNYSTQTPSMRFMGFKAHFKNIASDGNLSLYSLPGAYLGIAPVEDQTYNVACLAKLESVKQCSDPQAFIESLIALHPELYSHLSQGENLFGQWMTAMLPAFGIKQTPDWLDTYFIGDAAVTIPPACGNGLSMGIIGGRLAAEYAVGHRSQDFKKLWIRRCNSQVFWAKLLHRLMLNPSYSDPLMRVANYLPYLSRKTFDLTRQPS